MMTDLNMTTAQQNVLWFYADHSRYLGNTLESRFLEPSFFNLQVTRIKSRLPLLSQHCNFTPDFSNYPIFRTKFLFHLEV